MTVPDGASWLRGPFRANPELRLQPLGSAPDWDAAAAGDPDAFGLLVPRGAAGGTLKVVDRDTALLYYALAEPGPLPAYLLRQLGRDAPRVVARLVLDAVLQVEHRGAFVTGAAALAVFASADGGATVPPLSLAALRHGAALGEADGRWLAGRLYAYNTVPDAAEWRSVYPDRAHLRAGLGLDDRPVRRALAGGRWRESPSDEARPWWNWERPARRRGVVHRYKLYLSPHPRALPQALAPGIDALGASRATAFKVGSDRAGILRPDKWVAYFDSREDVLDAADRLLGALGGAAVQGLPFAARVEVSGLLWWGMDPPPGSGDAPSRGESWRYWVASELAAGLLAARVDGATGEDAVHFALKRLELLGISPATFTPSQALFAG